MIDQCNPTPGADPAKAAQAPGAFGLATVCWQWNTVADIRPADLLGLMALRSQVFVVEQRCLFLDIDDADRDAWHLHGRSGTRVVATLRLLAPGVRFAEASIGRVCVAGDRRGTGLGRELMVRGLEGAARLLPGRPVRISAQQRLEVFYHSLGFDTASDPYDEDGISHVEMLRSAVAKPASP
ncbi:MAG: GNAT family N-acetyltransferase [Burkholderiaceae bacterium]